MPRPWNEDPNPAIQSENFILSSKGQRWGYRSDCMCGPTDYQDDTCSFQNIWWLVLLIGNEQKPCSFSWKASFLLGRLSDISQDRGVYPLPGHNPNYKLRREQQKAALVLSWGQAQTSWPSHSIARACVKNSAVWCLQHIDQALDAVPGNKQV